MRHYYAETDSSSYPLDIFAKNDKAAVVDAMERFDDVLVVYEEMPFGKMRVLWEEGDPKP